MSTLAQYHREDIIVAPATAFGGALAVVRLSGNGSLDLAQNLLIEPMKEPRRVSLRKICFKDEQIDEALVCWFEEQRSFTGEELIEFSIHGSAHIARKLISACVELGAMPALPGEFSFRAVRNGKLTLHQASAIGDIVDSSNDRALALALEKLSGRQGGWLVELAEELKSISTYGELGMDFSDQDIDELSLAKLKARLKPVEIKLLQLLSSFEQGRKIQTGVSVAIVGRPNAGKSSLFNALLGEDRSIVTDEAGTTRDVVGESITLESCGANLTFRLLDTAGIRGVEEKVEKIGVERSLTSAKSADLVIGVIDLNQSRDLGDESLEPDLVVYSKSDLLSEDSRRDLKPKYRCPHLFVSVTENQGLDALISKMIEVGSVGLDRNLGEIWITRKEQAQAIESSLESVNRAKEASTLDLFSSDLRHALVDLAPLIGDTPADEILGRIFSGFCIGK